MSDHITEPVEEQGASATAVAEKPVIAAKDRELEMYRTLLEPPKEYRNGFTWTTVAGAFFVGLLMMPGTIFLSLMTGGGINASWVTLIIFSEISRRALKTLNTQELVVLLYVAGAMSAGAMIAGVGGGPVVELIYRQFFVNSDAVRDAGLTGQFPTWWVPQVGSAALNARTLFHADWLIPIAILLFMAIVGKVQQYTLGYFFFRLTSDVEKLPFPMAPISAQGAMALAESGEKQTTWKWKVFSIGAMIGLAFAAIQIGIPLVSGAVLAKPIQIIPLPWYDTTTMTEGFLPATPTGMMMDLGMVLVGMVIPFWAVIGSASAVLLTLVLNPILYHFGILTRWQPGMDTVSTSFSNQIDFWMSFIIGATIGVAIISVYQTTRDVLKKVAENKKKQREGASTTARRENLWEAPAGRGDFSPWAAVGIYLLCSILVVFLCHRLVADFPIPFLLFFTFLYTPFISYVNARIIGIAGNQVDIPFVREGAIILSGYKGLAIWLAPIPLGNYGFQAQSFRVNELTGTNFWSYVKADMLVVPLSFVLSLVFWAFIWHAGAIPSESFPWAQKMWDLTAKNQVLLYSATLKSGGEVPLFFQALHLPVVGGALGFTLVSFIVMSLCGLPIMTVFGFIQAVGVMPHATVPLIIGALIGKFYFQKRFGQRNFLQMAPVLVAGYSTGVGLIALIGVALNLIMKAISAAPF